MYAIRTLATFAGLTFALCACEGNPTPTTSSDDPAPSGPDLVVGSSIDDWTLLSIPVAGGPAELRSLRDPANVLWRGESDIPQAEEAYALQGGQTVLRTSAGEVLSYRRLSDEVLRLDSIAPAAEWVSYGSSGLYLDRTAGGVLHVSRSGTWRYAMSDPVLWASPLDDETVAILVRSSSGTRLLVLQRAETTPAEESSAALAGPGVALAWGRRLALASEDQDAMRFVTVGPVTEVGSVDLPGPPTAMAASPSAHEVYVAVDSPPRLIAVNRFSHSRRELGRFESPIVEIRTSLLGESLMVWDGRRVWHLGLAGKDPVGLDIDWRADLPLGLPSGRVLGSRADQLLMIDVDDSSRATPIEPSADHFWLPMHRDAAAQTIVADEIHGERMRDSTLLDAEGRDATPGLPVEAGGGVAVEGDQVDAAEEVPARAPAEPAGFYAIVGSARQQSGIADLTESLGSAGYPTRVQSFPDDAGAIWYRGLVGPYRTRAEADAAARQLTRERRLQAWVTEIGADASL